MQAFLKLNTIEAFHRGLNPAQRGDFERHLRKYLCIYHPQAGFEICSTDRYPGPKSESCVIAIRSWRPGEIVKYLAGTIVAMTEEEEDFYEAGHDFSILHSSRLDSMCLFLGPARFVNHDCSPNGAFVTQGGSIAITLIKPVELGEEITVYYSPDYFGPNNLDCLCATCERGKAGGYRAGPDKTTNGSNVVENEDQESLSAVRARAPDGKRNRLQTIEVTANSTVGTVMAHIPKQMATPPDSELSIDDIAKTFVYLSDDDSFHSADEGPESEDEDFDDVRARRECSETVDTPDHIHTTERLQRRLLGTRRTNKRARESTDEEADSPFARKILRPRKSNRNYNLKRQSRASLNPRHEEQFTKKMRRPHRADMDYCSVCDDEVPQAVIEEIWSNLEQIGVKDVLCKRCERHANLYGDPWPNRTPKDKAIASDVNGMANLSDLVRARSPPNGATRGLSSAGKGMSACASPRKRSRLSLSSNDPAPSSYEDPISAIELAKARMKRGSILVPHLTASLRAARQQSISEDIKSSLKPIASNETLQPTSQSLFGASIKGLTSGSSFDKTLRPSFCGPEKTEARTPIDHPATSQKCAVHHSTHISESKGSPRPQMKAQKIKIVQRRPQVSVSPNSRITTHQVGFRKIAMSPKVKDSELDELYDFDRVVSNLPVQKTHRRHTLPNRSTQTVSSPASTKKEGVDTSASKNPRSRNSGTWFYVEVDSSDSEKETPVLTKGRTRGQERRATLGTEAEMNRKVYQIPDTSDEDDSSVSIVSYRPPTEIIRNSVRRPRPQMWEYISIDSEEEKDEKQPVILEGTRAARRKSAPVYKF